MAFPSSARGRAALGEIIRKLGEGGMGIVLLARDTKLGRLVAIKLLRDRGRATSRLLAEALATARCRHEGIVVIHEVDETDGRCSGGQDAATVSGTVAAKVNLRVARDMGNARAQVHRWMQKLSIDVGVYRS
ncbi:MAG: hypothetical protein ACMG6S_26200 [Byssovorax sp.]